MSSPVSGKNGKPLSELDKKLAALSSWNTGTQEEPEILPPFVVLVREPVDLESLYIKAYAAANKCSTICWYYDWPSS